LYRPPSSVPDCSRVVLALDGGLAGDTAAPFWLTAIPSMDVSASWTGSGRFAGSAAGTSSKVGASALYGGVSRPVAFFRDFASEDEVSGERGDAPALSGPSGSCILCPTPGQSSDSYSDRGQHVAAESKPKLLLHKYITRRK
jgi:hypothetical protein